MQIETTIRQVIKKDRGESAVLERTIVTHHGDNPSFERGEAAGAADRALHDYTETNALNGTRPL